MLIWIVGSGVLRWVLTATARDSTSIYGPLAAPIAVMIWLYLLAIAVLIGAALNASFDQLWPESGPATARIELVTQAPARAARCPARRSTGESASTTSRCDLGEQPTPETRPTTWRRPGTRRIDGT